VATVQDTLEIPCHRKVNMKGFEYTENYKDHSNGDSKHSLDFGLGPPAEGLRAAPAKEGVHYQRDKRGARQQAARWTRTHKKLD